MNVSTTRKNKRGYTLLSVIITRFNLLESMSKQRNQIGGWLNVTWVHVGLNLKRSRDKNESKDIQGREGMNSSEKDT